MSEIDYEVETHFIQQWGTKRPISLVVALYQNDESVETGDDFTTRTSTHRKIQTWQLTVDPEETV